MTTENLTPSQICDAWRGGLIVSCQAPNNSPLARPDIIAALALVANLNGAVGVRIEGAANVRAVKEIVRVPILGIEKIICDESEVYITPTFASAARIAKSGAHVIALDATARRRPDGETLGLIVKRIKGELGLPVMADVATFDDGARAIEECGVDFISTTLAGYTADTQGQVEPDFALVEVLAKRFRTPIICEGRLRTPTDVERAFEGGAFAVVVGTAITGVDSLVRNFAAATPRASVG